MRIPFAAGLLLVLVADASAVTNVLGNGTFTMDGVLMPWSAGTGTPTVAGGVCTLDNASIVQTVPTTAGGRYYLALEAGGIFGVTFTASPTMGGAADATGMANFGLRSVIFTASTASTTLTISGTAPIPPASTVDNVVLVELGSNPFTGKYSGSVIETSALDAAPVTNQASRKVRAAVDADGRIYVLDGAGVVWAGMLFADATFSLRARDIVRTGTATVKGRRVEIRFSGPIPPAADEGGNVVSGTLATRIVLNRAR